MRRTNYAALCALALTAGCASAQPRAAADSRLPPRGGEPSARDTASPASTVDPPALAAADRKLQYPEEPEEVETAKGPAQIAALKLAAAQFRTFIQRAGNDPALSEAVKRARERLEDITLTVAYLENAPSPIQNKAAASAEKRSFGTPNSTPPTD